MLKIIKKLILKFIEFSAHFFSKKATDFESLQIEKLRNNISKIEPISFNSNDNTAWWYLSKIKIRKNILEKDPRFFLRWENIIINMFPVFNKYLFNEYKLIQDSKNFNTKWKNVIQEDKFGRPLPFLFNIKTSGSAIHATYHAKTANDFGINFCDVDVIFEFGGGYGKLCSVIYKSGFSGKYIIFDFPEFCAIASYYLSNINYQLVDKLHFVSDIEKLNSLNKFLIGKKVMFIATWSLSETPLPFRKHFLPIFNLSSYFLIAYYSHINVNHINPANDDPLSSIDGVVDNEKYFTNLLNYFPNLKYTDFQIRHMKNGNRYLLGMPKEN